MKKKYAIYSIFIAALLLTGCSQKFYNLNPQSHFDYPNSNVTTLGQVTGKVTIMTLFLPPQLSGRIMQQAVEDALSKKSGADMVINYTSETKMTNLYLVHLLTYKISGTAAKMSIGSQELR